jgi:hypothetical protein
VPARRLPHGLPLAKLGRELGALVANGGTGVACGGLCGGLMDDAGQRSEAWGNT